MRPGIVLLVALVLRLAFVLHPGNFDARSYEIVAGIMARGGNVYAETTRYNYSPVWAFTLAGLDSVRGPLPLHVVVRIFISLVDVGNAALLMRIADKRAGMLYALNPGAVILAGLHGQFEALAILPILIGLWRGGMWGYVAGIVIKHNVLFMAWPLAVGYKSNFRKVVLIMVVGVAALCLTLLPFIEAGVEGILNNLLRYRPPPWPVQYAPYEIAVGLMAGMVVVLPFIARRVRWPAPRIALLGVLTWLAISPSYSAQYFTFVLVLLAWNGRAVAGLVVALGVILVEMLTVDISLWPATQEILQLVTMGLWLLEIEALVSALKPRAALGGAPRGAGALSHEVERGNS